jgi:hypothetical protein
VLDEFALVGGVYHQNPGNDAEVGHGLPQAGSVFGV